MIYKELLVKQDRESIERFGFLQEIIKIDEEKENAETAGSDKLKELNRILESYSCTIIEYENGYTRAGMSIDIDGVNYIINSTEHSFSGGIHYVKMELERRAATS